MGSCPSLIEAHKLVLYEQFQKNLVSMLCASGKPSTLCFLRFQCHPEQDLLHNCHLCPGISCFAQQWRLQPVLLVKGIPCPQMPSCLFPAGSGKLFLAHKILLLCHAHSTYPWHPLGILIQCLDSRRAGGERREEGQLGIGVAESRVAERAEMWGGGRWLAHWQTRLCHLATHVQGCILAKHMDPMPAVGGRRWLKSAGVTMA